MEVFFLEMPPLRLAINKLSTSYQQIINKLSTLSTNYQQLINIINKEHGCYLLQMAAPAPAVAAAAGGGLAWAPGLIELICGRSPQFEFC